MAEPTTFIKLDRNILDWRWYKNANTSRVFLHLLINANVVDNDFETITVHRGEVAASYKNIADALGMTVQEVRTAITHLKSTGELTSKKYPKYQVFSILRYSAYQDKPQAKQQSANKQATGEQQQYKNVKNNKNTNALQISDEIPDKPIEKFSADSNPCRCAVYLAERITDRLPNKKIPEKTIQSWALDFDKLNRLDGQDWKDIAAVLDFSQSDPFWNVNILSAGKFRKKYDQLYLKMQREEK